MTDTRQFDMLITGGSVIDGSGTPGVSADVGVRGETIAAVGDLSGARAETVIAADGLTVMPGVIDCHAHSDLNLLADPRGASKLLQGVTTELNGQCGLGVFPVHREDREALATACSFIAAPVEWTWESADDYLRTLEQARPAYSCAAMIGHSAVHAWAMGFDQRPPTADELEVMRDALRKAFDAGCAGISFGLAYAPGSFADDEELVALIEVAAERDRLVSVHVRDEGGEVLEAIGEFAELFRRAGGGGRLQIDHLKCSGQRWWGRMADSLALIENLRAGGLDIAFDCYPYTAGSRHLSGSLPDWVHAGGAERMLARIALPETRDRLRAELDDWRAGRAVHNPFELPFDKMVVTGVGSEANQSLVGSSTQQIADARGCDPVDAFLDLLIEEHGHVNAVLFSMSEEDMNLALTHPLGCVATDGLAFAPAGPLAIGAPHPRCYGTFPRLLGHYVRERGLLSLEEAVRKVTSCPAARLGVTDRGIIAAGKRADLMVFDADAIADTATYDDPHRYPVGIAAVIVGGQVAVENGVQSEERFGGVLRI
jgi:N-acyl-D-amino-acid deacylase